MGSEPFCYQLRLPGTKNDETARPKTVAGGSGRAASLVPLILLLTVSNLLYVAPSLSLIS